MPSKSQNRVIAVVLLCALQVAGIVIYRRIERGRHSAPAFGVERLRGTTTAPDILLERADGTRLSVHAIDGRRRLIHFWATWCPPCVKELPGLLATSRALKGRGLSLVAISMDSDWGVVRDFFGDQVPPEIFRAVESDAHKRYDVYSLPDSYLVRPDGRLQLRYGGARLWRTEAARRHLEDELR